MKHNWIRLKTVELEGVFGELRNAPDYIVKACKRLYHHINWQREKILELEEEVRQVKQKDFFDKPAHVNDSLVLKGDHHAPGNIEKAREWIYMPRGQRLYALLNDPKIRNKAILFEDDPEEAVNAANKWAQENGKPGITWRKKDQDQIAVDES